MVSNTPIVVPIATPRKVSVFRIKQPEQRDHDGRSGEQHGAAGGIEGRDDGGLRISALIQRSRGNA